jgi:hypothetical protein
MHHAIDTGKSGASTTISVWVELLLGQDITALLQRVDDIVRYERTVQGA